MSPQYHVVLDNTLSTVDHMRKVTVPGNRKNMVEEHSELSTQENFTLEKYWHLNESCSMPLPKEAWQEDPIEADPQDPAARPSPQATPRCIREDPDQEQVT